MLYCHRTVNCCRKLCLGNNTINGILREMPLLQRVQLITISSGKLHKSKSESSSSFVRAGPRKFFGALTFVFATAERDLSSSESDKSSSGFLVAKSRSGGTTACVRIKSASSSSRDRRLEYKQARENKPCAYLQDSFPCPRPKRPADLQLLPYGR